MFILKILGKFIKVLRSAASPRQIAWGFALGCILGLTPFWSLHNLLLVVLILFVVMIQQIQQVVWTQLPPIGRQVHQQLLHQLRVIVQVVLQVLHYILDTVQIIPHGAHG